MKSSWLVISGILLFAMMMAKGGLLGQSQWISNNCGGSSPTLDRILLDACTAYEPDEYIIFHTGSNPYNVQTGSLSIQVNVTSNPYVSDDWGPNPAELAGMNNSSGCGDPLFLDPFAPPYNGVIPPFSNVMAFVQRDPEFSGSLSGLCGEGAIFVIFGDFSHSFSSSMFGNTCMGCTRNIEIQLGSCNYDITYEPERLSGGNGAYIRASGSTVQYGNASGCKPSFHHFPGTAEPNVNPESISICENDTWISGEFRVSNGNNFTAWYTDPNGSPIHYGPRFTPPAGLFSIPINGESATRNLYVENVNGGRPSNKIEISLITNPAPDPSSISLLCHPDKSCEICEGADVSLGIKMNETYGIENRIRITDGSRNYRFDLSGDGIHQIELPGSEGYELRSVINEYGCQVSAGFAEPEVSISIRDPVSDYLPDIPDLCIGEPEYILPENPGGISGQWTMEEYVITSVEPEVLDDGTYMLQYMPAEDCVETETTPLTIHPSPKTGFSLPSIECSEKMFVPILDQESIPGGTWTIDPVVPILSTTGAVTLSDLTDGETYTWTYTVDDQCMASSFATLLIPDCTCEIEANYSVTCQDNNSPSDPTDDTYTFELTVTGSNTSDRWLTQDGSLAGEYRIPESFGPFPISEGTKTLTLIDENNTSCQTTLTIEDPATCSNECTISATLSNIQCQDNGSPKDPADDTYTFELTVAGSNNNLTWISDDGQFSGIYDSTYQIGPFPIVDGSQILTLSDSEDSSCASTVTIDPPPACSDDCEIKATVSNISCDEQGSPVDSTDDVFTFDVHVRGRNNSDNWMSGDGKLSGIYDSIYQLGPFPIADGSRTWTILDGEDSTCQTTLTIDPPPACSDDCEIKATVSNISCDDPGSPVDSTDDVFTSDVHVRGRNNSDNWMSGDGEISGIYDSIYQLGPFPIADGSRTWTILDGEDSTCRTTLTIDPPPACSDDCEIKTTVSNISCDDQGSPVDYTDDVFTFDVHVRGRNNSDNWMSGDGELSGIYDSIYQLGPFPIADGSRAWTILDGEDSTCRTTLTIDPPPACSDDCEIKATVSNISCDDQGSPVDSTDDVFTFDVHVRGRNHSDNWMSGDGEISGIYDSIYQLGPFPITDGSRAWTILDGEDSTCRTTLTIDPPPACSDDCEIIATVSTISCDDQGSPVDSTDDVFTFDVHVRGRNNSDNWMSEDGELSGIYDSIYQLGPFPIDEGSRTWTILDGEDSTCRSTLTINPPPACSNECEIKATVSNISCDDQGSPVDSTDDVFTFDVNVRGRNHSDNWMSGDGEISGIYDSIYQLGPFPITDGSRTWTILDGEDSTCRTTLTINPPPACSNECEIKATVSNISCDDQGSPVDSTDDVFTFDVHVRGRNHSENWMSEDGELSGIYDSIYQLGPFPIDEGSRTWTILDGEDSTCRSTLTINPPPACSNECEIAVHLTDSCVIDEYGQRHIYYALINDVEFTNPLYYVYQENQLIDVISGNGNVPIGPFTAKDTNKFLVFSYYDQPQCTVTIQLTLPDSCHSEEISPGPMGDKNTPYFPNAFSPNGDGVNDLWLMSLPRKSQMLELRIFNKWGELINFSTSSDIDNLPISWDGKVHDQMADPGMYLYKITWNLDGRTYVVLGEIYLLR